MENFKYIQKLIITKSNVPADCYKRVQQRLSTIVQQVRDLLCMFPIRVQSSVSHMVPEPTKSDP